MTLQDDIRILLGAPTMNPADIRTLLRTDHDEILTLARDMYESESADERRALFKQLKPALVAHSRAEEKEVYDRLRYAGVTDYSADTACEGYVEHGVLDDLLEKLGRSRKTETDEWKAHAKVLLEFLQRHVEEEQGGMFELLGEHYTDELRESMGRRFLASKARYLALKMKAA